MYFVGRDFETAVAQVVFELWLPSSLSVHGLGLQLSPCLAYTYFHSYLECLYIYPAILKS